MFSDQALTQLKFLLKSSYFKYLFLSDALKSDIPFDQASPAAEISLISEIVTQLRLL